MGLMVLEKLRIFIIPRIQIFTSLRKNLNTIERIFVIWDLLNKKLNHN